MKPVSKQFTDADKQAIDDAVRQAESKTSAEIVPVVAGASGRYDRPEDIVGLWTGAVAMIVAWLLLPPSTAETASWAALPPWCHLVILLAVLVLGFVGGAILGAHVGGLRRLFTPRQQMIDEVNDRAHQAFATSGVYRTRQATGVLIYVSLFERRAVILGDKTVVEKIGTEALDELRDLLIERLRRGDLTGAFCDTIARAGERLAPALPHPDDDTDELPNELIIIDGP